MAIDGTVTIINGQVSSGLVLVSGVDGANYYKSASVRGTGVLSGALISSGGTVTTEDNGGGVISGGTMLDNGVVDIKRGGRVWDFAVSGGKFTISGGSGAGVTVYGGSADFRNVGTRKVYAYDLTVSGGNATVSGAVVSGLAMYGGVFSARISDISDFTMYGGTVNLMQKTDPGAADPGSVLSGAVISGGTVKIYRNAAISGGEITGSGTVVSTVRADALVADMVVQSGGYIHLTTTVAGEYGSASRVTIRKKGSMWLEKGMAYDTVVSGGSVRILNGAMSGGTATDAGYILLDRNQASAYGVILSSGGSMTQMTYSGATVYETIVRGGTLRLGNGTAFDTVVSGGLAYADAAGGRIYNVTVYGGAVSIGSGVISGAVLSGGSLRILNNGTLSGGTATGDGRISMNRTGAVAWDTVLSSGGTMHMFDYDGVTAYRTSVGTGGVLYVDSGIASETAVLGGIVQNRAVISGGTAYSGEITNFGSAVGVTIAGGAIRVRAGGEDYDTVISSGGVEFVSSGAVAYRTVVSANGNQVMIDGGAAEETTVESGGSISFIGSGAVTGATLRSGAQMFASTGVAVTGLTAEAGANINIDFQNLTANPALFDTLANVDAGTNILILGTSVYGSYKLADIGNAALSLSAYWKSKRSSVVAAGETYTNAFTRTTYGFNAAGDTFTTAGFALAVKTGAAAALSDTDTALNANDLATRWTAATVYSDSDSVYLAANMTTGNAWLEIDGTDVKTALYGTAVDQNFAGAVNLYVKSGTVRNLAAGAANGGSVGAVNLTVDAGSFTGTAYAGGFGSVTGNTSTVIGGGTFDMAFYGGALRRTNGGVTNVKDVELTVNGGTFSGNVFGASAVKTAVADNGIDPVHTVRDATLTLAGGSVTNEFFCAFGGGYATGKGTGTVYTVNSTDVTVSGGSWGTAHGGRGIYGGILVSGVTAEVTNGVNIRISGTATMGNVYGGGWAQQGGSSVVTGEVNITISGGTVENVVGGGCTSTSGGSTKVVGGVNITVSGGSITGDIYVRGQGVNDSVTGNATAIFTGSGDYSCGVYGYDYVGGSLDAASFLKFTDYTGTQAGKIVGFANVEFSGATAATWSMASTDVELSDWIFDLTSRADGLAGSSLLDWGDADFAGDTLTLNLSESQALVASGWSIAGVGTETAYGTFAVELDGDLLGTLSALDTAIGGDSVYKDWGFTVEENTLRFKNLLA